MWQHGACYIRVSTDDQTEFSPDAQIKAIKEYAKKNRITLTKEHIYIDEGISGKRAEKRPAFMQMIGAAKTKPKPFDIILVHKFDRFARSREDSVVYKSLLKKEAGIKVVSITESIEDDKFSIILEAMLEAMAEYYSLNLAEEVKKGMTEKAARGGLQSRASFGYRIESNKLVIVPEQAAFVRFIFNKFAGGEMSMRGLAEYANDNGITSHRGCPFENRTIDYILNNPVYIGMLRWTPTGRSRRNFNNPDTIIAKGGHEPIIDLNLWERAQKAIADNKELYGKRQKTTVFINSWSNGLVKCGSCGKSLVRNGHQYYRCNGYAKGTCKTSHSIPVERLENLVLEQLKETFQSRLEITIAPKRSDIGKTSGIELLKEQLDKFAQRTERIKAAYMDGIDTIEEYRANKLKLENDRITTENKLKELQAELLNRGEHDEEPIIKKIENAYTLLKSDKIPTDVKYKASHFLISKIVFSKQEETLFIEYK